MTACTNDKSHIYMTQLACPGAQAQLDHGCPGAQPQPLRYARLLLQWHKMHNCKVSQKYHKQGCVDVCNLCANGISIQTSSMCIPITHCTGIHTPLHTASRLVQAGSLKLGPNAIHQTHTRHAYCRPVRGVRISAIHSQTKSVSNGQYNIIC